MATEPTLGRRIMIEATICKDAPAGSAMASKAWDDLRALCALADAAERGMVASSRYIATIDGQRAWATGTDSELTDALAAWRALGKAG